MIHDPDTLNALLDSVERFVRERLVPAEHVVQETDEIPEDIVAEMKELGLFGLTIPEEYGGLGLTMEEEALVIMVMGQTSPAFRSLFGTTVGIGNKPRNIVVEHNAVAAENFTCPAYGLAHSIGADRLRQCRMFIPVDAFILRLRQSDDQSERAGEVAQHPHQKILDELESSNGPSELLPGLCVLEGVLIGSHHDAHGLPGHACACAAEHFGRIAESSGLLQTVGLRNTAIGENDIRVLNGP